MRRPSLVIVSLLLFPVLLNLPELLNVLKADPALLYSGMARNVGHAIIPGIPLIDPSVGFIFQSLGKRAADEWLQGKLPWWNPFEGVGVPLAGEMNSAAFYPLTMLLELPRGQVLIQVIVQAFSGLFTWKLLRKLGVNIPGSMTGALLFEMNGTVAWLGSGWIYGMPSLPLLLLGIELVRSDERTLRFRGGVCISAAVFLSVAAGFIEIPFLNGLLGVLWVLWRFAQSPRARKVRFAGHVLSAGAIGIALALPLIIAFVDYLRIGFVAGHDGDTFFNAHLGIQVLPQKFLPYIYGPIFHYSSDAVSWGSTGGYAGFAMSIVALSGVFGASQRPIRLLLILWVVLALGATFGLPFVHRFVLMWPGVRYTAQYRYFDTSWEFALALLAGFAIDDSCRIITWRYVARMSFGVLVVAGLCAVSLHESKALLDVLWPQNAYPFWFKSSLLSASIALVIIAFSAWALKGPKRAMLLTALVCVEAAALYTVPTLSYPTSGTIDGSGPSFLRQRIGLQRVYAMGTLSPNYGSFFGVASVNHNDIPMPQRWTDFVRTKLDPYIMSPLLFLGTRSSNESAPTAEQELIDNRSAFERIGVQYVVTPPRSRNLLSASFEPQIGSGEHRPLPLLPGESVEVVLSSVPAGHIDAVEVFQGNYSNTTDGSLEVQLCDAGSCSAGTQALSASVDNDYLSISLKPSQFVRSGSATLRLTHVGGTRPEAIWLWANTDVNAQRARANGNDLSGFGARLRLDYASQPFELPGSSTGNEAGIVAPGQGARIDVVKGLPSGEIHGMGIFIGNNTGTADGRFDLKACSGTRCVTSERDLRESADNSFFWFQFKKPLAIRAGSVTIEVEHKGGQQSVAIWLFPQLHGLPQSVTLGGHKREGMAARFRFDYQEIPKNPATLIYKNEGIYVYELPGATSYIAASGCSLSVVSREDVQADCPDPATLKRLEFDAPGWSATVNGFAAPIQSVDEIFQKVALPAGKSAVAFSFVPPFMQYGYFGFLCALVGLISQCWFAFGWKWRSRALV